MRETGGIKFGKGSLGVRDTVTNHINDVGEKVELGVWA